MPAPIQTNTQTHTKKLGTCYDPAEGGMGSWHLCAHRQSSTMTLHLARQQEPEPGLCRRNRGLAGGRTRSGRAVAGRRLSARSSAAQVRRLAVPFGHAASCRRARSRPLHTHAHASASACPCVREMRVSAWTDMHGRMHHSRYTHLWNPNPCGCGCLGRVL